RPPAAAGRAGPRPGAAVHRQAVHRRRGRGLGAGPPGRARGRAGRGHRGADRAARRGRPGAHGADEGAPQPRRRAGGGAGGRGGGAGQVHGHRRLGRGGGGVRAAPPAGVRRSVMPAAVDRMPKPAPLDRMLMPAPVDRMLRPRSIAVVGASNNPSKRGYHAVRELLTSGYPHPVYPVNPRETEVLGLRAYPAVSAIAAPVDLAFIATPADTLPEVLADCGRAGVAGAVAVAVGFAETGAAGRRRQEQVLAAARRYGVRLIGPN